MGVPSSPGRAAPRAAGQSINFYLAAGLIVPVTIVLALWGLAAAFVLGGGLHELHWLSTSPANRTLIGAALITGGGLVVVIVFLIRLGWLGRRVSREISRLTVAVGTLSAGQLPGVVAALPEGARVADDEAGAPDMVIAEITRAAMLIADLRRAAVEAVEAEASLRHGFRQILLSLGRRNQSLLYRQLRIIDGLEQQANSPAALADLFTLDHLTTRMRRHAESLTILSGVSSGRSWSGAVPVIDVMRAAAAEVEDYTRVTVISDSDEAVSAHAVTDMIHLLAELVENATLFSPSSTRVEIRAERVANGFAIEVEDRGLGIPPDQLAQINAQLASPPDFDLADADRLGLFVAGRLAARHGVHVSLNPSPYRGTRAVVVMPDSIITVAARAATGARADGEVAIGPSGRLNLRATEVLSLTGAVASGSASANGVNGAEAPSGNGGNSGNGVEAPSATGANGANGGANGVEAPPANGGEALSGNDAERPATHADASAEQSPGTTIHGLPRRVRSSAAQTAPEAAARESAARESAARESAAREPGSASEAAADGPWLSAPPLATRRVPPEGPAPEHARTLAASLQNSWQRSRQADEEQADQEEA